MKRIGVLLAFLSVGVAALLMGCPPPLPRGAARPPRAADLRAVDRVISEGVSLGLNVQGRCMDERNDRMVIVDADEETMRRGVGYCASQSDVCIATAGISDPQEQFLARAQRGCLLGRCAGGATIWVQDDVWPANLGRWRVEMYISAYVDQRTHTNLVVHEAVHWILGCASTGPDHRHVTPGMWGAGDSLEGRVQAALAAEAP